MTDAKHKDQAMKEHPNLGQDEAAEEREGKDKMQHMEGDKPHSEPGRSQQHRSEKSPQRPAQPSKV